MYNCFITTAVVAALTAPACLAEQADTATMTGIFQAHGDLNTRLAEIYRTVKDEASAQAAAKQLTELSVAYGKLADAVLLAELPKTDEDKQALVAAAKKLATTQPMIEAAMDAIPVAVRKQPDFQQGMLAYAHEAELLAANVTAQRTLNPDYPGSKPWDALQALTAYTDAQAEVAKVYASVKDKATSQAAIRPLRVAVNKLCIAAIALRRAPEPNLTDKEFLAKLAAQNEKLKATIKQGEAATQAMPADDQLSPDFIKAQQEAEQKLQNCSEQQ